jgi:hypothetical protein
MFSFQKNYFFFTILLLLIEVFIAVYIHDRFVRPYIGDLLVVILIYCFLKNFWNASVLKVAVSVLLFAFAVEASQYFNLINHLGLQNSRLSKIILGSSFHWFDMLAYTLGIILVIGIEKMRMKER